MKKIILLLLLPLLAIAQPAKLEKVVILDSIQSKAVLLDLEACEFCKKDIIAVTSILEKTEIKAEFRNKIIDIMQSEAHARLEIIQNYKDLNAKSELQIKELEKIIKKERLKKGFWKFGGLAVGLAAGYLLAK